MFSMRKNCPISFESCRVAKIGINYYNTVGSSKNAAYKRNRKIYKKNNNCFNIAYKFD